MTDVTALITRWNSPEGHPYKGQLIDINAYDEDPDNIGCMCAQGQALHLLGGYEPRALEKMDQDDADEATAELLGISRAHAVLLRNTNDRIDGAPAIVLTNPELVIGDQAPTILAFWRYIDRMTEEQRIAIRIAAWGAAWAAIRIAAGDTDRIAARVAARVAARNAAWDAAEHAAWASARDAVIDAAWGAADNVTAWDATAEIMGASVIRERGQAFYFLPMFGFANPEAVLDGEAM